MPDDPHVTRTIRTPNAVVTIKGTLNQVDKLYRAAAQAFLAIGYSLHTADSDPWAEYGPPPDDNTDHLRRRIVDLEQILSVSENRAAMQAMRSAFRLVEAERDLYKEAFITLDANAHLALTSLTDDPEPNLYSAVARTYLSE